MSLFKTGIIALGLLYPSLTAQPRFVKITPENAILPDGSLLKDQSGMVDWKWLPGEGNGGVIESRACETGGNAQPLRVVVDGLTPNADYEVFGCFWAPGFGEQDKDKEVKHWPARFGFGMASLTTYGGREMKRIPWIVSLGSRVGTHLGVSSVLEESSHLAGINLTSSNGDTRLVRARVGVARADGAGKLPVCVDDFPNSIHCELTRIDGIALQPAPKDSKPSAGTGDSAVLHLALRANDWPSAQRELAAGADVNALDPSGMSTLYHPATCGDQQTVKRLLEAGAKPNMPGQSIPVLTAAASTGDVGIVRLLLGAGAEVPATRIDVAAAMLSKTAWAPRPVDQSRLHPAIAAIRAGSLETLKALLEKRPDLDLESLGAVVDPQAREGNDPSTSRFLIEDAMSQGHDELAAFLIDHGCTLSAGVFLYGSGTSTPRPYALLARSITNGKALEKTCEALLRRGVAPIRKLGPPLYSNSWSFRGIEPWDGLSAAVYVGDLKLTQRFLLQAEALPLYYEEFLLAMARWNGEPLMLDLLKQKFPDAGKSTFTRHTAATEDANPVALRLLLPRTKPVQTKERADNGTWTMAVIASPEAGGQGASIEVEAANNKGWKVVDRQEVDKALRESQIAEPWGGGKYRFAEFGDRMSADLLVLVSLIDGKEIKLLRFEVVDVATGLAVLREHVETKAFEPNKSTGPLLQRVRAAITRARSGDRPKAITLLPFSIDEKVFNARSLKGVLRASVQAEVDASPGILSVGMDEIKAIAGEQALGGEGAFWSAAYTLEGGVAPMDGGRISLTLRMQSMKQGGGRALDHTEEGRPTEIPALVAKAWKAMVASNQLGIHIPQVQAAPDAKQAAAEAARLLREAEWLLASKLHVEALPLLERASLLGANPEPLVRAHYNALVRQLPLYTKSQNPHSTGIPITPHPLTLRLQQRIFDSLAPAQELLDQMAYYQARHGKGSRNWKESDFWNTVEALSFIRASIPKVLPNDVSKDAVSMFCESLDQFTSEYLKIQTSFKDPDMLPTNQRYTPRDEFITAAMFRRNPELLKGWVSLFFTSSARDRTGLYGSNGSFADLLAGGDPELYGKKQILMQEITSHMNLVDDARRSLRESELAYACSVGEGRAAAARAYCTVLAKLGRRAWYQIPRWLQSDTILDRFGMSAMSKEHTAPIPDRADAMIAPVVHEPFGSNDWISHGGYDPVIRKLVSLEEIPYNDAKKNLTENSPWEPFIKFAEAASKEPDSQNALKRVVKAAGLWEVIYGRLIHNELQDRCRRLYSPPAGGKSADGLDARLLVDLRQLDKSMPGMFFWPTVDNKDKERMWLYYQPFEKTPDVSHNSSPLRRYPQVAGIDCSSGAIKVSANIINAPGLDPGRSQKNSYGIPDEYDGFLAQTDALILTSVNWPGMNYNNAGARETGVLIRKDNGQLVGLKSRTTIRELADLSTGTVCAFGAVALGDQFIAAKPAGDRDIHYGMAREEPHELVKIGPDGTVTAITTHGRRPQISPFDPIDRIPKMMVPDGNRVLVIHDWDHAARFSPANDSWELCEDKAEQTRNAASTKVNKDYREQIFSCHKIPKSENAPELIIQWEETLPDKLAVSKRGADANRIKVNLEMPEGFAREPVFADRVRDSTGKNWQDAFWTYEKHKDSGAYTLVVLHQTKTHLILALQIGKGFHWSAGKRTGQYLPMLWALPIKNLQDVLMEQK